MNTTPTTSKGTNHFATKLIHFAALSSGAATLLVCVILFSIEFLESQERMLRELQTQAHIVAANSVAPLMFNDAPVVQETLMALHAAPDITAACAFDSVGEHVGCYQRDTSSLPPMLSGEMGFRFEGQIVELAQPIRLGNQTFGTLVLRLDVTSMRQDQLKRAGLALFTGCLAMLLSIALAYSLKKRLTKPLDELLKTAKRAGAQDYTVRAKRFSNDEFGELTSAINQMLNHIQERDQRLQQETERAQAAEKAKGTFLSNMSHEVRTPLNGVLGMISLLLETEIDDQQRDMLNTALLSGKAMTGILNDILDLAKFEAGRIDLERIDFDLRAMIAEVLELLSEQARSKGVEMGSLIRHDVPQFVNGDPTRIRQVVTNLLSNAVKFTAKGHVLLHARWHAHGQLHVEVEDTGIGIEAHMLERVFKSFTQADESVTRQFGGTGLGLTLSQRFVELMGGRIGVTSELGVGSHFSFTIPVGAASEPGRSYSTTREMRGWHALVICSKPITRKIIGQYLTGWEIRHHIIISPDPFDLPSTPPFNRVIIEYDQTIAQRLTDLHDNPRIDNAARFIVLGSPKQLIGAGDAPLVDGPLVDGRLSTPVRADKLLDLLNAVEPVIPASPEPSCEIELAQHEYQVLVVEDNLVNQKVAKGILQKLGCKVVVAENGQVALDLVAKQSFDIVFMDCQMPVLDGLQATQLIRDRENGALPCQPIVAMTAHAMEEHRDLSLAAGMNDHITKPVSKADFARMLKTWCADASQRNSAPGRDQI